MSERTPLTRRLRRLSRRFGIDVHRVDKTGIDARRLQMMRRAGIQVVLDVGANQGQYGRLLRDTGYGAPILSFEPLNDAFAQLLLTAGGDRAWTCHNLALGASEGNATLHVAKNSWSSSLLPMDHRLSEVAASAEHVRDEDVIVTSLDTVLAGGPLDRAPAFLKLDTQGSEMDVLRGAAGALGHTPLIEVELSVAGLYVGQPHYQEVLSFLETRGYELAALEEEFVDPRSGALLEFNSILIRAGVAVNRASS